MKKAATSVKKSGANEVKGGASPSRHIDARIKELGDWRGETLARIRGIIKQAVPDVVEEWKWRGVPVWEHDGIICTGETYKAVVKMTFARGAALDDPTDLFNSSLEGNTRRAIDFYQGDKIDEKALKALIREAAALNMFGAGCPGRNRRAPEEAPALGVPRRPFVPPRTGRSHPAARIACQMREDVAGMSRCRTPSGVSAFITAFMMVAGAAMAPA